MIADFDFWIRFFVRLVFVYVVPTAVLVVVLALGWWFPFPKELVVSLAVIMYVGLTWSMHFGTLGPDAWLEKRLFAKTR
jgi:hypothetical protein